MPKRKPPKPKPKPRKKRKRAKRVLPPDPPRPGMY